MVKDVRPRSLLLASSFIASSSSFGCDKAHITRIVPVVEAGEPGAEAGSESQLDRDADVSPQPDAADADASDGRDAAGGQTACEQAAQRFDDFVSANGSCSEDSDCTMIGDCGPNIDGAAINVAAAAAGYALMQGRCNVGYDGATYGARCQSGQCVIGEQNGCCGCGPIDAGGD